jgi:DNA/RNA endonuclease YhcR with UshA esterase domain
MDAGFGKVFVVEGGCRRFLFAYSDEYAITVGPGDTVEFEGRVYAFRCRHQTLERTVLGTVLPAREEITLIPVSDVKES